MIIRTEKEINDQIDKAYDIIVEGGGCFGMTYEEGVKAALEWVSLYSDDKPIEEE